MSKYLIYKGPNSFESSINYGPRFLKFFGGFVACFKNQHVVNVVINTVQKETQNRMAKQISPEKLSSFFDQKKIITGLKCIDKINSPHIGYEKNNLIIKKINNFK